MIRTIIFDLGNVLVYFNYDRMFKQIADVTGLSPLQVKEIIFDNEIGLRCEEGALSIKDYCEHFARQAPVRHEASDLLHATANIFEINESIYPVVKSLKSSGNNLILLSNTCEVHFDFIKKHFPIVDFFDHTILSYKVNARKPNAAIYETALAAAKSPAEECLYIDDIAEYVDAAKELGIEGAIYRTTPQLVDTLQDLRLL